MKHRGLPDPHYLKLDALADKKLKDDNENRRSSRLVVGITLRLSDNKAIERIFS